MNHVIIVAGGIGSRMNLDIPKQYYEVKVAPIIMYSYRKFSQSPLVDSIVFVVADEWKDFMEAKLSLEPNNKKVSFAKAGRSRQHSVYNGLCVLREYAQDEDVVLIHDAVRPLFPETTINDGIEACREFDGALPVISVKDATYQSYDGIELSTILPRQELFSGQSPEFFIFGKFFKAHASFSEEEISNIRGCSELAFKSGLSVKLIPGTERNFKITTIEDLRAFELTL